MSAHVGVGSGVVMAREGLRVREVSEVEGNRLLRIVRKSKAEQGARRDGADETLKN
jgi:hypothetical protein